MANKVCRDCPFRRSGSKGMDAVQIYEISESFCKDKPFPCKGKDRTCFGSLSFAFNIYNLGVYALDHVGEVEYWTPPNFFYAMFYYRSVEHMIQGHQS